MTQPKEVTEARDVADSMARNPLEQWTGGDVAPFIYNLLAELDRVNALREREQKEPVVTLEISNEGMGDFWLETFNGGPLPHDEKFEGTYRRVLREGE